MFAVGAGHSFFPFFMPSFSAPVPKIDKNLLCLPDGRFHLALNSPLPGKDRAVEST